MLKWCVIDSTKTDTFVTVCESKEDAIKKGDFQWDYLTKYDRSQRVNFCVGTCNVDTDGNFVENEAGIIDSDIYEVAKDYLSLNI